MHPNPPPRPSPFPYTPLFRAARTAGHRRNTAASEVERRATGIGHQRVDPAEVHPGAHVADIAARHVQRRRRWRRDAVRARTRVGLDAAKVRGDHRCTRTPLPALRPSPTRRSSELPAPPVTVATLPPVKLNVVPPASATSVLTPLKFIPAPTLPILPPVTFSAVAAGAVMLSVPEPV